jgi:hypothetical protein
VWLTIWDLEILQPAKNPQRILQEKEEISLTAYSHGEYPDVSGKVRLEITADHCDFPPAYVQKNTAEEQYLQRPLIMARRIY